MYMLTAHRRREHLARYTAGTEKVRRKTDNQLLFAYWSCLQLERYESVVAPSYAALINHSDILAKLRLPQTLTLRLEEQMPFPNLELAMGYSALVLSSYQAQAYLQLQLNRISELFKGPRALWTKKKSVEEEIHNMQMWLAQSRHQWVPPEYRWKDGDSPANDILAARLRAKYWDSQIALYQPFLDAVLHPEKPTQGLFAAKPVGPWEDPHIDLSNYPWPPNMDQSTFPRALNYSRGGIQALMESTKAFHGLNPINRFVVMNHFPTTYA